MSGPAEVLELGWHEPAPPAAVQLIPLADGGDLPLLWGGQGAQMIVLGFDIPPGDIVDLDISCALTRRDDGRDLVEPKHRQDVNLDHWDSGAVTYTNLFMVAVPGAFERAARTEGQLACRVCGVDVLRLVTLTDPTPAPERPRGGLPGSDAASDHDVSSDTGSPDQPPDGRPRSTTADTSGQPGDTAGADPDPPSGSGPVAVAWTHCTDEAEIGITAELWPVCRVCLESTTAPSAAAAAQSLKRFEVVDLGLEAVPTAPAAGFSGHPAWILVEDVDADGIDDLLFGTPVGPTSHWWSRGTTNPTLPFEAPVPIDLGLNGQRRCLGAADLDGDGRRDLVCDEPNSNIGAILWGTEAGFGATSPAQTLTDPGNPGYVHNVRSASFGDLDRDGAVDVFLAAAGRPATALLGAGDRQVLLGTSALALPQDELKTFFVTPFAWDSWAPGFDGLWVANDGMTTPNHALRTQSGKAALQAFDPIAAGCDRVRWALMEEWLQTPLTLELAAKIAGEGRTSGQHGGELGTFDGEGATTPMGAACWYHLGELPMCVLSQAAGPTPDYAVANTGSDQWGIVYGLGLERFRTTQNYLPFSWGLLPLDLGDGRVDLVITNARDASSTTPSPMDIFLIGDALDQEVGETYGENFVRYYAEQPDGGFLEVGQELGLDVPGQFATVARFFAPGPAGPQLHLIVGGFDQPFVVYRLEAPTGHLLRVSLRGTASEPNGLGALLTVVGGPRVRRARYGAESVQWPTGNTTREAVFGVGSAPAASIWVQWPSGLVEVFEEVAADSIRHELVEATGAPAEAPPLP